MAGDFNAQHLDWFSRPRGSTRTGSRRRGDVIGSYIGGTPLQVLNQPGHPSTFRNSRGAESDVEVTLASPSIADACGGWRVRPGKTQSDHRIIEFEVGTDEGRPVTLVRPGPILFTGGEHDQANHPEKRT